MPTSRIWLLTSFQKNNRPDCLHRAASFPCGLPYAALFWALTLAHLARCAAAIFFRATADIVRLLGIATTFCFPPLTFAHRALWAAAIRALPAADNLRRLACTPERAPNTASAPVTTLSS